MNSLRHGVALVVLAVLTLTLVVTPAAAQDASPVVETPTTGPDETTPVASPSSAVPPFSGSAATVTPPPLSDPTITFSCTVDPSGPAVITYSVNANGHALTSWTLYPNMSSAIEPEEISWSSDSAQVAPLEMVYYGSLPAVISFATRIQAGQRYSAAVPVVCGDTMAPSITLSCTVHGYRATISYAVNANGNDVGVWQLTTNHASVYPNMALGGAPSSGALSYIGGLPEDVIFTTMLEGPSFSFTETQVVHCPPMQPPGTGEEAGAVIVRVETDDGSDLPDGVQACVDADCEPLGALASMQLMALALPSGSGVAFSAVPIGPHDVTLRDADGAVLDSQRITVVQNEVTEVTFVLDRPVPTATSAPPTAAPTVPPTAEPSATSMAVTGLPKTGQGDNPGSRVPWLLLGLCGAACLAGITMSRRTRSHD